MNPKKFINYLTRGMYAFGILFLLTSMLLSVVSLPVRAQQGNSGAVWTTTGSCGEPQNINQYQVGDNVYLNGANFDPNTEYHWSITGNPGGSSGDPGDVVAEGNFTTDANGAFCFFAYTILPDDWGVYKYDFGGKNDNYSVDGIVAAPALTLDKTVAETSFASVGDELNYTYVLTNTGNVPLESPNVTDDKTTVICPAVASLAPGASMTCTATYTVTQADLNAGFVTNLATGTGVYSGTTYTATDTETVNGAQTPGLTLVKTATPGTYDSVGDVIEYTLVATNTGNVTLTGVTISDPMLDPLTCAQPVNLAPGGTLTCTGSYTIVQADLDAGSVENTGTVDSNETAPVQDTEVVIASGAAVLSLVKTATPSTYNAVGDVIEYTLVATNDGNVTLTGVTISDPMLDPLTCSQPVDLAPGATLTCTGSYTIVQGDLDSGSVSNTATADSNETAPVEDTEIVTASGAAVLSLVKSADPTTFAAVGDVIEYTLVATNEGNVTLTGVTISDPMLDPLTCTQPVDLAPGATLTCTGSYTIVQADLDAGVVENTGTADSNETAPVQDTVIVTTSQTPSLTLEKTADPTIYDTVGDVIEYTLVATNTGNVTLTGVTISDPMLELTCTQPVDLAPGETLTCTGSYTIVQADLDAGSVENTGTADSNETDPVEDTEIVTADGVPVLSLVKTAEQATYAAVGDVIDYTLVATNEGNVTLTGVTISDPMLALTCDQPVDLAPGETLTCTGSYTIVQADLDAGSVENTGTADSNETVPVQDSEIVTADLQAPQVSITAENTTTCAAAPGEECITFTVNISGLQVGTVSLFANAPANINGDQQVVFSEDGEYLVTICGDWPGISDPGVGVELLLSGYAEWSIDQEPQGQVGEGSATVSYDPSMEGVCFPLEELLFIDPFCYRDGGQWTMAVQVENPNDQTVEFAWSLNGGTPQVANAAANGIAWLANLPLGTWHTIAISWGADGFAEQRARLNLADCQAQPTPTPPVVPTTGLQPVPVTAVEEPAPVSEAAELIPVTGIDLGGLIDLGYFKNLMLYVGLSFLGAALIIDGLWRRFH